MSRSRNESNFIIDRLMFNNSAIAPATEHVAKVWGDLDQTDFSHMDKR